MLIAEVMAGLNLRNYPYLSTLALMMAELHLTWEETSMTGGTMGALHTAGHARVLLAGAQKGLE